MGTDLNMFRANSCKIQFNEYNVQNKLVILKDDKSASASVAMMIPRGADQSQFKSTGFLRPPAKT